MTNSPESKVCTVCCRDLPLDLFSIRKDAAEGRRKECKECRSKLHAAYRHRTGYRYTPDPARKAANDRRYHIKKSCGLSDGALASLRSEQNDRCAICGRDGELQIDHCHTTGKIRGLLCGQCNRAIGMLGDDAAGLERALNYVRKTDAE